MKLKDNIVRLGMPINDGTNLYPMVKDDSTRISPIMTVARDGVELWNVSFTTLDCTYIESVRHISGEGPFPLEVFARRKSRDLYRAIVAHVNVDARAEIKLSYLESCLNKLRKGDALIVNANNYTDKWLKKSGGAIKDNDYNFGSPYFGAEAMRGIIDAGASIIAGNFPSFSNPQTKDGFGIDMIVEFYKNHDNLILAPLVDLKKIKDTEVVLQINPVMIKNRCGVPCCPVAYQGELKSAFMTQL